MSEQEEDGSHCRGAGEEEGAKVVPSLKAIPGPSFLKTLRVSGGARYE